MAATRVISDFSSKKHNHKSCVKSAVKKAESICIDRGMRLTRLRRKILELVWSRHGPLGAYDILQLMNKEEGRVLPNTVYRGLDFLIEAGLIHRLDSMNAFMGCADPVSRHSGQFLICRSCESAAEIHDAGIEQTLGRDAKRVGFSVEQQTIEVLGLCPSCSSD